MNRNTLLVATLGLIVVAGQACLLYRLEALSTLTYQTRSPSLLLPPDQGAAPNQTPGLSNRIADRQPSLDNDSVGTINPALQVSLQQLDARLAAIERLLAAGNGTTHVNREPNAAERVAADQRLLSLLPSGPLNREDMARFHAALQTVPPDERFAVATALARAINEGRVQPAPDGL